MAITEQRIQELAQQLARHVGNQAAPSKPRFRIIEAPRPTLFDSITRECCIRRTRDLVKHYRLQPLLAQELFDEPGLDSLSDEKVAAVLTVIEKAAECCREGIPLEDAGLLRTNVWIGADR